MAFRNHQFKTTKESKKGDIARFILAFVAFAVVFGSMSLVVILKNNEVTLRDIFEKETTTGQALTEESTTDESLKNVAIKGHANIMVYCSSADESELYCLQVVEADLDNQVFKVYPVDPDGKHGGKKYIDILKQSGEKVLMSAVSERTGLKIDRYIGCNANTFALAINYMGGLEYDVQNRIEYRNKDYTLILTQGKQTIKGENLLRFIRYCKTTGDEGMRTQGKIICAMIDGYINEENTANGPAVYKNVLSKINSQSDISYIEAVKAQSVLQAFCISDKRQDSRVVLIDGNIR